MAIPVGRGSFYYYCKTQFMSFPASSKYCIVFLRDINAAAWQMTGSVINRKVIKQAASLWIQKPVTVASYPSVCGISTPFTDN